MRQKRRTMRMSAEGVEVVLRLPPGQALTRFAGLPENWLPFSHTEVRVLLLLLRRRCPLSREQIATALDESVDGRLRGVLAALNNRRALMIGSEGYQVNAHADEVPALLRLLELSEGEPARPYQHSGASPPEEETTEDQAARIKAARAAKAQANGHSNGRNEP